MQFWQPDENLLPTGKKNSQLPNSFLLSPKVLDQNSIKKVYFYSKCSSGYVESSFDNPTENIHQSATIVCSMDQEDKTCDYFLEKLCFPEIPEIVPLHRWNAVFTAQSNNCSLETESFSTLYSKFLSFSQKCWNKSINFSKKTCFKFLFSTRWMPLLRFQRIFSPKSEKDKKI